MVLPEADPVTVPEQPALPSSTRWRLGALAAVAAAVVLILVFNTITGALAAGHYKFMEVDGEAPVTWDHCHAIRYQVNPRGAPEDWEEVVHRAIDDIEKASGFVFVDAGTTTKTDLIGRRYDGNEWEPVLIMWSDRYQDSRLDGNTIGLGGSAAIDVNGVRRYVTGRVRLDSTVSDPSGTKLTLEHELGHVLGLDHVDDPHQLMYPSKTRQDGLGKGDIAGLRRLHDVPCG